jgi:hypothetical protein
MEALVRETWMEILLHLKRHACICRCDVFEGPSTNMHFKR